MDLAEQRKTTMKNIIQLRNELCQVFEELRSKELSPKAAKEIVNAAGKIINSVKIELEYANLRKEVPVIVFLGGDKTPLERSK